MGYFYKPTTLSVTYDVNNDVTDHIVVRFKIFRTPIDTPQARLLEYYEVPVKHNPGQWITMVAPTCYTTGKEHIHVATFFFL